MTENLSIHWLGLRDYYPVWQAMRDFALNRERHHPDQLWLLQHFPVYTLGEGGEFSHLLDPGDITVIRTDRGGEITYHGPGQAMIYPLIDLRRFGLGLRGFVKVLEEAVMNWLRALDIPAEQWPEAPGVYVEGHKIGAIGLRTFRRYVYHGLALNVNMDLEPFSRINPCGYRGLKHTQVSTWRPDINVEDALQGVTQHILYKLGEDRHGKANDQ